MRRAIRVYAATEWPAERVAGSVTLAYADRHRRRIRLADDSGKAFLLDLEQPVVLKDGDGLALDDGGFIAVRASEEDVMDIQCRSAAHAALVAWHIGNRHRPMQVLDDSELRLGYDHVLAEMIVGLGAGLRRRRAPFAPEGGAYAPSSDHSHRIAGGHRHDHGHEHDH